ncbi:hypothetical protein RD110_10935 [Rhodoferax koreense]|uniref:Uncharacterized protein n=1 Tax=Rhodoferax koreensis TaxID=1842727 RepID=A0A1P8JV73_9BURK|nr:hypothetical protein [Rhodoferax koreense]APW37642.1 hypothetical protein RD110_10935 [Rhodoferax koreense]
MTCERCNQEGHDIHQCRAPLMGLGTLVKPPAPQPAQKRHRGPNKNPRPAPKRAKRLALKLPETTQEKLVAMAAGRKRTQFIVNLIEQEHARRFSPQPA